MTLPIRLVPYKDIRGVSCASTSRDFFTLDVTLQDGAEIRLEGITTAERKPLTAYFQARGVTIHLDPGENTPATPGKNPLSLLAGVLRRIGRLKRKPLTTEQNCLLVSASGLLVFPSDDSDDASSVGEPGPGSQHEAEPPEQGHDDPHSTTLMLLAHTAAINAPTPWSFSQTEAGEAAAINEPQGNATAGAAGPSAASPSPVSSDWGYHHLAGDLQNPQFGNLTGSLLLAEPPGCFQDLERPRNRQELTDLLLLLRPWGLLLLGDSFEPLTDPLFTFHADCSRDWGPLEDEVFADLRTALADSYERFHANPAEFYPVPTRYGRRPRQIIYGARPVPGLNPAWWRSPLHGNSLTWARYYADYAGNDPRDMPYYRQLPGDHAFGVIGLPPPHDRSELYGLVGQFEESNALLRVPNFRALIEPLHTLYQDGSRSWGAAEDYALQELNRLFLNATALLLGTQDAHESSVSLSAIAGFPDTASTPDSPQLGESRPGRGGRIREPVTTIQDPNRHQGRYESIGVGEENIPPDAVRPSLPPPQGPGQATESTAAALGITQSVRDVTLAGIPSSWRNEVPLHADITGGVRLVTKRVDCLCRFLATRGIEPPLPWTTQAFQEALFNSGHEDVLFSRHLAMGEVRLPRDEEGLMNLLRGLGSHGDLLDNYEEAVRPLVDATMPRRFHWNEAASYSFQYLRRAFQSCLSGTDASIRVSAGRSCPVGSWVQEHWPESALLLGGRIPTPSNFKELQAFVSMTRRHRWVIGEAAFYGTIDPLVTLLREGIQFPLGEAATLAFRVVTSEMWTVLNLREVNRETRRGVTYIGPGEWVPFFAPDTPAPTFPSFLSLCGRCEPAADHPSLIRFSGGSTVGGWRGTSADHRGRQYSVSALPYDSQEGSLAPDGQGLLVTSTTYREGRRYPKSFAPPPEESGLPRGGLRVSRPRAEVGTRPRSYAITDPYPPPTQEEYERWLHSRSRLRYFVQPASDPTRCVALILGGEMVTDLKILLDDGSNCCLITERCCRKLDIPVLTTKLSLTTSNAKGTPVIGVTPIVQVIYGPTSPEAVITYHSFLVVGGMDEVYEVLLGNVDSQQYGGRIETADHSYSLRPKWATLGKASPILSLPTLFAAPVRPARRTGAGH